jgi:ankyrin repeat protein
LRRTEKTLSACRAALYSTDPEIDRNNIIHAKGGRTQGTCEWIKNHTRFQSWLNGDKRLLWIRGGPGKGKTVMSVYLTEEMSSEQPCSSAYFFCTGQDAERNSASAVLRGLLWQIIKDKPKLQQYLLPYFDPPERGRATRLSEETLWNLFRDTCRHADIQRLYCLVDGVDECDEDSMHWLVDKFIGVEHHDDYRKLSLLVLSRPVVGLRDSTCITLDPDHHGQISADVEIFVRSKARELSRKLRVDGNFEENTTRILLEKSEGTFLWVGFVMSEVLKKKTRSQVEKAMYSLPKGLPAVYARMLQNIEPDDQENGKRLLACMTVAFKPLSLKTLADILGCRSSATISEEQATLDAIAVCAPMLHIRDKKVDLVHQSAKDYLLRGATDVDPLLEGFRFQPEVAHLYLARRCIQSLTEGSWLQHYSIMNWPNHAKHLGSVACNLLEQEPGFFEEVSVPRDLWWREYSRQFLGLPKAVPPRLHIACFLGDSTWVRAILFEIQRSGKSVAEIVDEKCPGG